MKKFVGILLMSLMMSFSVSCIISEFEDDPLLSEGTSTVSMNVQFRPLISALDGDETKSPGGSIKHIESLWVVVYKNDGTWYKTVQIYPYGSTNTYNYTNSELNTSDTNVSAPEGSSGFAESTYCHSTFDMELPLGKYRIYAVANHDLGSFSGTEDELKSINLQWNSDVAKNNQMFGFFTDNDSSEIPSEVPVISIDRASKSLHAWVKRAASKVTVSFDGSNLYENIYIYIHSIQIKDIPTTCFLGKQNSPDSASELIASGETIYLRNRSSSTQTEGLRITKGLPTGGQDTDVVHGENAEALFFYENMQGTDPKKHQYNNFESKDNKPFGTYIEVKGYYVNKTADNASQGEIIYRFMLGKNVTDDFNAERSNHYKVVLKFRNSANDPDWHIEYEPESPEISVPSPMYISYGYNEVLNIPVIVRGASVNSNTTIRAEIIENPWGYPEHKYYNKSNHDDLNDGFLSLENKSGVVSISESQRNSWDKEGSKYHSKVYPQKTDLTAAYYSVPVYTRPLILANSLTGHNPYVSHERKATVKFTVTMDGKTYSQTIEVIQVKRLVNPAGVWRSDNNTSPFNIRLMELNEPDADENGMRNVNFVAPYSDGPWTAHIEEGSDWVQIAPTGSGNWGTSDVTGGTGSEIRFDYRPKNANTTGNVRCGVIKVTYHNNTCVHYVFVSQGNGTINIAGSKWQNRNVLKKNELVANPLMEGSMFKFGNPSIGILVENNHRDGYGFNKSCWGKTFKTTQGDGKDKKFEDIGFNAAGFVNDSNSDRRVFTDNSAKPSTYQQWKKLETLHRRYGVLYGDECNATMTNTIDAYSYYQEGQQRGMQGMFVWDESRKGNHIFFPIGSTGNGHRKVNDNAYLSTYGIIDKYSLLKYAQRPKEMPVETAKAVPMYYDIWLRKGAVYWYDVMYTPAVDFEGYTSDGYAHDINFHSMLLQTYGKNANNQKDKAETTSTDGCYIRCVEP